MMRRDPRFRQWASNGWESVSQGGASKSESMRIGHGSSCSMQRVLYLNMLLSLSRTGCNFAPQSAGDLSLLWYRLQRYNTILQYTDEIQKIKYNTKRCMTSPNHAHTNLFLSYKYLCCTISREPLRKVNNVLLYMNLCLKKMQKKSKLKIVNSVIYLSTYLHEGIDEHWNS